MTTTWRAEIAYEMTRTLDPGPIIHHTGDIDTPFDPSWGKSNGAPFTAWTERRVYFPIVYDGAEWAGSAPRNPCDEATGHQGRE